MTTNYPSTQKHTRPPIIAVMGHIDHGKSTLLDYIRKTRVVETEIGGITQRLSAYEVEHTDATGNKRRITFLDTPGHEAFQNMRLRGAKVADIVILVVSAEDGVKAQTLEALEAIKQAEVPFVVAINKIDKPNANIERTKMSLIEKGIYLEGMGGDVPFVSISAKTGEGIGELLDMLLLVADLEELSMDPTLPASGVIIESHRDPKKGVFATLLITNGVLSLGQYVVSESSYAPLRIIEDFAGKKIKRAEASSPILVSGFSCCPRVGASFTVVENKKEAERIANEFKETTREETSFEVSEDTTVFPVVIKANALGSIDAIVHELNKITDEHIAFRVIHQGVGSITEKDVQRAIGINEKRHALVVGFCVSIDAPAYELIRRHSIPTKTFEIIYELSEWLAETAKSIAPKRAVEEILGKARVLKVFSSKKNKHLLGGRVLEGVIHKNDIVKVLRGEEVIAEGKIESIQKQKTVVSSVEEGAEFGANITIDNPPHSGDVLVVSNEHTE